MSTEQALAIELETLDRRNVNSQPGLGCSVGDGQVIAPEPDRQSPLLNFQNNLDSPQPSSAENHQPPAPSESRLSLGNGHELSNLEAGTQPHSSSQISPRERDFVNSFFAELRSTLVKISRRVVDISSDDHPDFSESDVLIPDSKRSGSGQAMTFIGKAVSSIATPFIIPARPDLDPEATMLLGHSGSSPLQSNLRQNKSLGIFSMANPTREFICTCLVHSWTEPIIFLFIILQTTLFIIETSISTSSQTSAQSKFLSSWTGYCSLVIFAIFTVELVMRVIASGFILDYANTVKDLRCQTSIPMPSNSSQARQYSLIRRPFLRNFFNSLDFIAVVSFWIGFTISLATLESNRIVQVFRMLSALRIFRLLRVTVGTHIETTVILNGLKKAAPTLRRVGLFVGFFSLFFAIVGVQSFKSSLRRSCQLQNPNVSKERLVNTLRFCGGYLANETGNPLPWLKADGSFGAKSHKGFLCPRGSVCQETLNPYENSVSFDNILQSFELVFVTMSANTFSEIMYYLMDSESLTAAFFFAIAIIVLYYWLVILLVGVVTLSFHDENRKRRHEAKLNEDGKSHGNGKQRDHAFNGYLNISPRGLFQKTKYAWIMVIIYDLVVQAQRSASMSTNRERFINNSESIITLVLLVEIGLRFAVDARHFHRSKQNLADLAIAIVTSIMQLPIIRHSDRLYSWLTFFQLVRVYRVVWSIPLSRGLILIALKNYQSLLSLGIFLIFLIFLAAILATLMLRTPPIVQDISTQNATPLPFSNLWSSFIGMYQIFTGENWTTLLYAVTSYDYDHRTSWIDACFIILWFILSSIVILNMFLSRIQDNFNLSDDEKRLHQVKTFIEAQASIDRQSHNLASGISEGQTSESSQIFHLDTALGCKLEPNAMVRDFLEKEAIPEELRSSAYVVPTTTKGNSILTLLNRVSSIIPNFRTRKTAMAIYHANILLVHNQTRPHSIVKSRSKVRRICQRLVGQQQDNHFGGASRNSLAIIFKGFVYTTIVVKIVLACITTPLYQKEYFQTHTFTVHNWFIFTDLAVLCVLIIEASIRIIAYGLFHGHDAYFRGWNLIDAIVLVTLAIQVIAEWINMGSIAQITACFKALRVLRLLTINKKVLKDMSSVFTRGGVDMVAAVLVLLSLLVPFAIYGVNLFSGESSFCNDSSIGNMRDCFGEYNSSGPSALSVQAPRVVYRPYYSFNNFGSSFYTLFLIVSQEGWVDVMTWARGIKGIGRQPQPSSSNFNAVFFLTFNLCGTFFVMTLLVSIFLRNYTRITGVAYLTSYQRAWLEQQKLLQHIHPSARPSKPTLRAPWRVWCYERSTAQSGRWQKFIITILVSHLLLLCVDFYPSVVLWDLTRDSISLIFIVILTIDVAIRIVGLSWKHFITRPWDVYALLSLSGALITSVLALIQRDNWASIKSKELFQDSVCLLLIPRIDSFDNLFKTAIASLPLISTFATVWFVMLLFFAIALTQIFGLTRFGLNEDGNVNFRTIPKALILLFRMTLGEGRTQIMEDFAEIVPPLCVEGASFYNSDCGSAELARLFFISWKVLSVYLFTNIFISLIYEGFSGVFQRPNNKIISLSRQDLRKFKDAWRVVDPDGTGYMPMNSFYKLMANLSGIFSMHIYDDDFTIRKLLDECAEDTLEHNPTLPPGSHRINLMTLNDRLKTIPKDRIQHQRLALNRFHEELLLLSDPVRGVSISEFLLTLAHYKFIDDSQCLTFKEYVNRKVRLEMIDEALRRQWLNDFMSIYPWTRQLRKHREYHQTAENLR